jgi:hypothetical protein
LVDSKDIDTLSSELENRLDALFGENDIQLPNVPEKKRNEYYPLAELKNLILSIDWEITDEVLDNLLLQLKDLQLTYKHDKIVTTFLQILNSLGNYIRTHRAKAHPKTFKILNSVFVSLDKVVLSKEMTAPAKKKILRAEMNRYKELRTQIAKSKAAAAAKRKARRIGTQQAEIKNKKEDPVLVLDESSVTTEVKEKEEAPVLVLDESPVAPEVKEKEEAPVLVLDESPVAPEVNEKEDVPITIPDEPSVVPAPEVKEQEPVLSLAESSEPPAVAVKEGLPVTHPDSDRDLAVATLADAVEEIKQYIHTEINALKKEIQSLRETQ